MAGESNKTGSTPQESAADLRRRAERVRRLIREIGEDADAVARLDTLARDLERRASRAEELAAGTP